MPPTLADRVRHILEAILHIERALADTGYEQFAGDLFLRLAVERLLEIISEASRKIPADVKAKEPDIAWQQMADLGNRLRHAYHQIEPEILWRIANEDLAPLKRFVERIVRDEQKR
jgi:uncharacterized protein with HEPN domain